jgi:DNA (cytosine-5)-methyltransferase 1
MKILNLYAGIGGNRKLWDGHEVTAVEIDKEIAEIYQEFFINDKVIITDAHEYLLNHFKEFDFIWSSPPCPTHSRIRRMGVDIGRTKPKFPDMKLYEEIILLKHFFKGKWVVENVMSYYKPLIEPIKLNNHYFWSNFEIPIIEFKSRGVHARSIKSHKIEIERRIKEIGFNLDNYNIKNKRLLIRNCVNPKLAKHILKCING